MSEAETPRHVGRLLSTVSSTGDSLPVYRMREIIVTAKRMYVPLVDVAQSVSLLKRDDVEWSLANSSTDLAGEMPGVFIERTGDFGRSDVSIRGLGSNGRRSTVMVDGRPEKMALFGCTITHSFLLHDVQRIEVVRGPASLLYGSGAMGGVLNIITRPVEGPFRFDLKSGYGSFGTAVVTGRLSGRSGGFGAALSADYRRTDGHVEHSKYEGKDFHFKGEARISDRFKLVSSAKYFDGFKEEPIRATDSPDLVSDTWNDYRRGAFDVALRGEAAGVKLNTMYYRNFGEHEFSDGWHSKDATDGVILHLSAKPLSFLKLSGGADYTYQWGKLLSEPSGEWHKWETGMYLEGEVSASRFAEVSAGVRYDRDEVSGVLFSPSYGLIVRPFEKTTIRAFASKGFRTPQISELYMFPISNKDLDAETVWDYEIGLRQAVAEKFFFDLTLFKMDGKNLITVRKNSSPPPMYIFMNAQSFTFKGVEAALYFNPVRFLEGAVSYSYMDVGELTMGRPQRKLDARISLKFRGNVVRLSAENVGDYYAADNHEDRIGSYTVCNLYAEGRIAKGASFYAGVNNIFNEEYEIFTDIPGGLAGLYEMPRRNFMAGLKFSY